MKKQIGLLALFILAVTFTFAQEKSDKVEISWGDEFKTSRRATLSHLIGHDETGIYALKTKRNILGLVKKTVYLEHFDNEMNRTTAVELELEENGKEKDYEFIVQMNNDLHVFSSYKNQKLKKNFLFVQPLDKNTLQPSGPSEKVAEISYRSYGKYNSGNYAYRMSRDSSKVLVYYNLPYKRGENEKFGFHVYNNNMELLWEKDVELPYKDGLYRVDGFNIDNSGNVHLLGMVFDNNRALRRSGRSGHNADVVTFRSKRKGKPNYHYEINSYRDLGESETKYPIEIKGKFLSDMQITINEDSDIICGGFFSKVGTFSIKGAYFLKIDSETKEIVSESFKNFGIDFITSTMRKGKKKRTKKKAAKGKNVELYEYDLDEIVLKDDGGAILIGEQYYIRVVTTTTSNANGGTSTTTTYHYYYNDIIAINMSSDGQIEWAKKIAKRQHTTNDGGFYSSYSLSVKDDKMYFIFNDNVKNMDYKGDGKIANFTKSKKALAVLVTLDNNGNQEKEALFTAKEAGILCRPKVCEQISNDEVILFGQRKKKQRFSKMKFKN